MNSNSINNEREEKKNLNLDSMAGFIAVLL